MNDLGKGAVPDIPDERDFKAAFVLGAAQPDWSKEFRLPEPPDTNQGIADDCVGESSSSFHWQIKRKKFSVRSVFAYIALSYGAYLRDGVKRIVENGQETFDEAPDPNPKTPVNMRSTAGLTPQDALDDRERDYYLADDNIDSIALGVQAHQGAVFGITGDNLGWSDLTNPRPPTTSDTWGHALYAMGTHRHNVNGVHKKCIIAKSSWCNGTHHEHHINEDYFNKGYVFNAWILVPKETLSMPTRYIVQKGGKLGVLVSVDGPGVFTDTVLWAKSEDHFKQLKLQYEVPDNAPRINYP